MIHLGDITKIKGSEIPVVDCITGGSPCQDLSVAGKRAGLAGERLCVSVSRTRDGENPGAITLTMAPGALLGEYTMLSFGEYPSEENGSRLSQILEECPHPRYSLSARACAGILTRAKRRGKKLPEELERALQEQAGASRETP